MNNHERCLRIDAGYEPLAGYRVPRWEHAGISDERIERLRQETAEMVTTAMNVRRADPAPAIPDGEYSGTWVGYVVRFTVDGQQYVADTATGIRTQSAPCRVIVAGGQLTVAT